MKTLFLFGLLIAASSASLLGDIVGNTIMALRADIAAAKASCLADLGGSCFESCLLSELGISDASGGINIDAFVSVGAAVFGSDASVLDVAASVAASCAIDAGTDSCELANNFITCLSTNSVTAQFVFLLV